MTHQEIEALLGAYALDAVDADEAAAIELHLAECPRCRAEVASHREVAALLAHGGADAPAGVWDRIVGSLEEAPPALRLAAVGGREVTGTSRARRGVGYRTMAAITAVAAAVVALLGVKVADQGERIDSMQSVLADDSLKTAAFAALADPGSRTAALVSSDGVRRARVALDRAGRGYFVDDTLPALSAGTVYQLWAEIAGRPVSVGVVGPNTEVAAFIVDGPVTRFMVTEEQAGGVQTPTGAPVVIAEIA